LDEAAQLPVPRHSHNWRSSWIQPAKRQRCAALPAGRTGTDLAGWFRAFRETSMAPLVVVLPASGMCSSWCHPVSLCASAFAPATVSPGGSSTSTVNVAAVGGVWRPGDSRLLGAAVARVGPAVFGQPGSVSAGTPATLTVSTNAAQRKRLQRWFRNVLCILVAAHGSRCEGAGFGSQQKRKKENIGSGVSLRAIRGSALRSRLRRRQQ
jgi:hypothetical protein